LAGEIIVHLCTRSIKVQYFSPEGATKANVFSVVAFSHFYIKTILLTTSSSMVKIICFC